MNKETINQELTKYNITDAAISNMSAQYMPLIINGIDDREGLVNVHAARMVVKNHRVAVEKKRKELKEDSLAYGRAVDAEAKRICGLLAPIEDHLQSEEDKIQAIKDAIEAEKAAVEAAKLQAIEDARRAEEARVRAAEEARLEDIRKQQAAESARLRAIEEKQRAEQTKLQEERDAIEREKRAIARAKEIEEARKEAAEKARLAALERPDSEKLVAFADMLAALEYPVVTAPNALRQLGVLRSFVDGWIVGVKSS